MVIGGGDEANIMGNHGTSHGTRDVHDIGR
jgi:hypothetical protein